MSKPSFFHIKKHNLLAIAGCVWLIAGFNVARLGVLSYKKILPISAVHILLSAIVFCAFGFMFYKMSIKHTKRISGYEEEFRPIWHFFDLKSYCIMAFMMGGEFGFALQDLCQMCLSQCFIQVLDVLWHLLEYCFGLCSFYINQIWTMNKIARLVAFIGYRPSNLFSYYKLIILHNLIGNTHINYLIIINPLIKFSCALHYIHQII